MDDQRIFEFFGTMQGFSKFKERFVPSNKSLTKQEFWILHVLCTIKLSNNEEYITVPELKKHIKMTGSAISQVLNVLEDGKFILRSINENDRRCVIITITQKGIDVVDEEIKILVSNFNKVVESYGEEKFIKLSTALKEFLMTSNEITLKGDDENAKA